MEGRKKSSGYQNRKLAKGKQRKFDKIIEKNKFVGFLIKKPETVIQDQVSNCVSIEEIHNETTSDVSSLGI